MAHAEICPVCEGDGGIGKFEFSEAVKRTCHGCNGRGWVTVSDLYPLDPETLSAKIVQMFEAMNRRRKYE